MSISSVDTETANAESLITLTFGKSRTEFRWTDRRQLTFDQLADLLAECPVGSKDGPCFTPATFAGTARRMDQAMQIDIAVLDADAGHTLEEIEQAVAAKGWRAIIHSTYSHLSEQLIIAAGPIDKWIENESKAGRVAPVADYLLSKKGYLESIVSDAEIIDEVNDGDTRNYVIKHKPCPKFRIILPLDRPWIAEEFPDQTTANQHWANRITALAHALKLYCDQSCTDSSRLFYLPRRKEGHGFAFSQLGGVDCPLWELPDARPGQLGTASAGRAQTASGGADNVHKLVVKDGQSIDLTAWAAEYSRRFEIFEALRFRAPHVLSHRKIRSKKHIKCPNGEHHISSGPDDGTGCFVVNSSAVQYAGMPGIQSGFIIHCMHNGCSGFDRLDHLRAMIEKGWLRIEDLTDKRLLVEEQPLLGFENPMTEDDILEIERQPEESNIAPHLYKNLPGAMGEIHKYMMDTSTKPQPALLLGATLAFMAAVLGQRVMLEKWETRPNIYVIAVAHSGAGKERPMSAIKQMARAAGLLEKLIGVEEIVSDSGIIADVIERPRQVMLIDEIAFLFQAVNHKNSSSHLINVISTMLKLYSNSHTTYKTKAYAERDRVKIIDQPCVSLFGTCTSRGLFASLTSHEINNGLLSRVVLFDAGDHDPEPRPTDAIHRNVGIGIVEWLMAWDRVNPVQNVVAMEGGVPVIEPRIVGITLEAQAMVMAFAREMQSAKQKARDRGTDALYVRAGENALKFALIRACAGHPAGTDAQGPYVNESGLLVDAEIMAWAIELSRATVTHMEKRVDDIADTPFQEELKGVCEVIKLAGSRGITFNGITKSRAGKMKGTNLEEILATLQRAGDVFYLTSKSDAGGRPRSAYVHRNFVKQENIIEDV